MRPPVRTELEKVTLYRHKDGNRHAHDSIYGEHEGCESVGEFVRVDNVVERLDILREQKKIVPVDCKCGHGRDDHDAAYQAGQQAGQEWRPVEEWRECIDTLDAPYLVANYEHWTICTGTPPVWATHARGTVPLPPAPGGEG